MKFIINRETLLKPLLLVSSVVENKQTMPVLSNILIRAEEDSLHLTGSDTEVELIGRIPLDASPESTGITTAPARKLLDICKSLPDNSEILFSTKDNQSQMACSSGRSRFTLSTLPAETFPVSQEEPASVSFSIASNALRRLIDRTGFAMSTQDVRYYLNGMLFKISEQTLTAVATDGHRLAVSSEITEEGVTEGKQVIVPRKAVLELARLVAEGEDNVTITLGQNHICAHTGPFSFTSKLVDGKFPDYERVIPYGGQKSMLADRQTLRQALSRAAILSNAKHRGVNLTLENNTMKMAANNPEQEQAEDEIPVNYADAELKISFNVDYLRDVLSVATSDTIQMIFSDSFSSVLIKQPDDDRSTYVVMPMGR
ncbi:MAG: DNA polymerase III subunit beta [Kistimonas sp.]|nr:DNA polymerase III subunit beta [Kistimonas sp.]